MQTVKMAVGARSKLASEVLTTLYYGTEVWVYKPLVSEGPELGTEIEFLAYRILRGQSLLYGRDGVLHRAMKPLFKKDHKVWKFVRLCK